jgi:hypothetical protein
MNLARFTGCALIALVSAATVAQDNPPLAEAARAFRAIPRQHATKVFDNDNIPRTDKLSVVGPEETTPSAPAEAEPTAAEDSGQEKQNDAQQLAVSAIQEQRKQVDLLTRELDVLNREYRLRAASYYADAGNRLRNSANWDKEDAQFRQQIAAKQTDLNAARQRLDDLQEQARKAGVPSKLRE